MLSWANLGGGVDFNSCGEGKVFSSRNEQIRTCSDVPDVSIHMKIKALGKILQACRYLTSVKSLTGPCATFDVHLRKSGAPSPLSWVFLNKLKFTPTWNADLGIYFFGHMLHHFSAVHRDKHFRSLEAEHFLLQKRIYIFPDIAQATQAWIKNWR